MFLGFVVIGYQVENKDIYLINIYWIFSMLQILLEVLELEKYEKKNEQKIFFKIEFKFRLVYMLVWKEVLCIWIILYIKEMKR